MFLIDKLAEEKIQAAQEKGEFRHLALSGVPYRMDGYLFEDPRYRLENKILRDHNFLPLPLELKRRIEEKREEAAELIASFRSRYVLRLQELLAVLEVDVGYLAPEYEQHLPRHRRFLQDSLPVFFQMHPSSRVKFQVFLLNRAVRMQRSRLEEKCQEITRLIHLYNEEILRATLKRRDMFRNFTTMGFGGVDSLREEFEKRYPEAHLE